MLASASSIPFFFRLLSSFFLDKNPKMIAGMPKTKPMEGNRRIAAIAKINPNILKVSRDCIPWLTAVFKIIKYPSEGNQDDEQQPLKLCLKLPVDAVNEKNQPKDETYQADNYCKYGNVKKQR